VQLWLQFVTYAKQFSVQLPAPLGIVEVTTQAADQRKHAPPLREPTHYRERGLARPATRLSVDNPLIICPPSSNEWAATEAKIPCGYALDERCYDPSGLQQLQPNCTTL